VDSWHGVEEKSWSGMRRGVRRSQEKEDADGYQPLQYMPGELFLYPIFSFIHFCMTFCFTYIGNIKKKSLEPLSLIPKSLADN
jgi:hypothetical protein